MKEHIKVQVLEDSNNAIYYERENGVTHSAFQMEYLLYDAIRSGNVSLVKQTIENYLSSGFVMGRMSGNSIRQIQYWSISTVALAVHYAILGGVDETDAFNFSDICIRFIDKGKTIEECIPFLKDKAIELTELVAGSKKKKSYTPPVRKAIHYIHVHLHDRLKVQDIANEIGISRDYLSTIYKKEVGESIHQYILNEKIKASKEMLASGKSYQQISYDLGFCSETHFIQCFKKICEMTPGEYKRRLQF